MSLVSVPGFHIPIGPGFFSPIGGPGFTSITLDAANEAAIFIGRILTSDGGSHTIDTTGSSTLGWKTNSVTFANAGTTLKIGLAAVNTSTGPPGRAVNVADVITFDVVHSRIGGSGLSAGAWQSHTPTSGSKTITNGDLVAFCVQMTARGGTDSVLVHAMAANSATMSPNVTSFVGAAYSAAGATPACLITFSDGAFGWFSGADIVTTLTTRTWNSTLVTKEYGQLYNLPFPYRIYGVHGWMDPDGDCDIVLYSDPLGTPVAERTVSVDANTVAAANMARFSLPFSSYYDVAANQDIGIVFKPGASNVSTVFKTIANASYRITDPWGTGGYGISRASGAFANVNSSLDHYYIGLNIGAFEHGVWPAGHLGM